MQQELKIIGYLCDRCTRNPKIKKYVIVKDYKEHLRTIHKIQESHIPKELEGSTWEEEFVVIIETDRKCYKCNKILIGKLYPDRKDFLELHCEQKDETKHYHHNGRIYIGSKKLKYFCERHGYNSDSELCFYCDMEGSLGSLLGGKRK